jgi:hypothetical protein
MENSYKAKMGRRKYYPSLRPIIVAQHEEKSPQTLYSLIGISSFPAGLPRIRGGLPITLRARLLEVVKTE